MQKRECGDCSLCCKLPEINYFKEKKESFKWCDNCNVGVGCKIYNERPKGCRDFYCLYHGGLTNLKPNKVGFFIYIEREESVKEKILTIYSELNRLENIPKLIMKDPDGYKLVDEGYAFHIRYSNNEDEIAIFDLKAFGMQLKKVKRNIPFQEQINA
jgi:hypothetical protein